MAENVEPPQSDGKTVGLSEEREDVPSQCSFAAPHLWGHVLGMPPNSSLGTWGLVGEA